MQTTNRNRQGFTLIEVVLVLAIAGLIFLVVFLALPALQRSQRDTARKSDASRLMSQITNYQSNNQGGLPASGSWDTTFKSAYMTAGGQQFGDPLTGAYTLTQAATTGTAPSTTQGTVTIYVNARCDTDPSDGVAAGTGTRQLAIVMPVEQGGFYCLQN